MKKRKNRTKFKWGYPALALVSGAVGVCLLAFNNQSLEALAVTIGSIVALAGVVFGVNALSMKERGGKFALYIVMAVAFLVSGIATIITKSTVMNLIVGIFGLVLILDGGYKFETTAKSKRYRAAGWWIMLALSVALIAGGYIAVRRLTVDWSGTVYVLGALFIIDAVANLLSAFYLGYAEKRESAELREKIIEDIKREEEERIKKEEKKKEKKFSFFGRKKRKSEKNETEAAIEE